MSRGHGCIERAILAVLRRHRGDGLDTISIGGASLWPAPADGFQTDHASP